MITDAGGLAVGHWTDPVGHTGVSVVLLDRPGAAGVELHGGAHDVVGLDYLDPRHLVGTVDAIVLGGGSRFGEEAVYGVMRWLEERGRGFQTGPTVVPHVPGAFLFDLGVGDARARPGRDAGHAAAAAAAPGPVAEGSVGAGAGASVGKVFGLARAMRGGLGTASVLLGDGLVVGALVAVNALGNVRDPETGELVAGAREAPDSLRVVDVEPALLARGIGRFAAPTHTTIGVVATNARLDRAGARQVAALGLVGFARALAPPHTAHDGDALFAVSTGDRPADLTRLGLAAAEAVARAIVRGVRAATPLPGLPAVSSATSQAWRSLASR